MDENTGQSRGMTLTLSDWFYEGHPHGWRVLAIDPEYFTITGGRERWLYRVARKHAGGHGWPGFAIPLPTLFEKSGAEGHLPALQVRAETYRRGATTCPSSHSSGRRGEGTKSPPCAWFDARILLPTDPAYEIPVPRAYRHTRRS